MRKRDAAAASSPSKRSKQDAAPETLVYWLGDSTISLLMCDNGRRGKKEKAAGDQCAAAWQALKPDLLPNRVISASLSGLTGLKCLTSKIIKITGFMTFMQLLVWLSPSSVNHAATLHCRAFTDLMRPAGKMFVAGYIEEFGGTIKRA